MSTRYAYVWRREWRGTFKGLTKDEKLVLLALRTGPLSTSLPGLVEADADMLKSLTELTRAEVDTALAGLVTKHKIAIDPEQCMVRIFGMPDPEEPPAPVRSYKLLRGWWSCWRELPDSRLKYDHLPDIAAVCDLDTPAKEGQPSMRETWAQTFGKVSTDTPPRPGPKGIDTPSDTPIRTPSDTSVQRTACSVQQTAEGKDLAPDAGAPDAGHGPDPLKLEADETPAAKGNATRKPKSDPLPFTAQQASDAIGAASSGAYTAAPVAGSFHPNITRLIRRYPDLATFTTFGAYLATGAEDFTGPKRKGPSYLAGNIAAEAMVRAIDWHAKGRPATAAGSKDGRSPAIGRGTPSKFGRGPALLHCEPDPNPKAGRQI